VPGPDPFFRDRCAGRNGTRGDYPAGASKDLGNHLLTSHAELEHRLNEPAAYVGDPNEGRDGLDHGAHGLGDGVGVLLPVRDRVRADAEEAGGEVPVPSQETLDLEDPEALCGAVIGAAAVRDLVEASAQDLHDVPGHTRPKLSLLEQGGGFDERVVSSPQLSQEAAHGQSEEVGRGQGRAEGEPLGRGVDLIAKAEAERRGNGFPGRGRARRHGVRGPFRGAKGVLRGEDRLRSGGVKDARYARTFPGARKGKASSLTPRLAPAGRSSQATYGLQEPEGPLLAVEEVDDEGRIEGSFAGPAARRLDGLGGGGLETEEGFGERVAPWSP